MKFEARNPKPEINPNVQKYKQKKDDLSISSIFVWTIRVLVIGICFVLRYLNFGFENK